MRNCPEYTKAYREANREKIRQYLKEWRKKNKLILQIHAQLWRLSNLEKHAARMMAYRLKKGEELRQKRLKYSSDYNERNRERINKKMRTQRGVETYGEFFEIAKLTRNLQKEILCQEKRRQKRV